MARTHWPVPWFSFGCHHRICETDNVWTYFNSLLRKSLSTASDRSLMLPWVMWKGKRASRLRREDKQRQITFIQRHGQVITVLGWRTHCHDLTLGLCSMTPTLVTRSHWPTVLWHYAIKLQQDSWWRQKIQGTAYILKILCNQMKVVSTVDFVKTLKCEAQ